MRKERLIAMERKEKCAVLGMLLGCFTCMDTVNPTTLHEVVTYSQISMLMHSTEGMRFPQLVGGRIEILTQDILPEVSGACSLGWHTLLIPV